MEREAFAKKAMSNVSATSAMESQKSSEKARQIHMMFLMGKIDNDEAVKRIKNLYSL